MKNIIKIVSLIFVSSLLFTSCGSSGSDESYNSTTNKTNKTTSITGTVVDGPIYDANVSVYDMNGKYLGSTITSREDGKLGDYKVDILNLPSQYIIKVNGGKDSGVDGIINSNDKESFDMSAIGKNNPDKNTTTIYITPATTVITSMVNDENITLEEANKNIVKSLGLPEKFDLSKTNPKNNEIASKAGTLIAQIITTIPSQNKQEIIKSLAKEVKFTTSNNNVIANINSTSVDILDLNLTRISNNISTLDPDIISKIDKSSKLLNKTIKQALIKTKAINTQTQTEINQAISSNETLQQLSNHIQKEDVDTFDINKLESLSIKLDESFNEILKDNITLTKTNIQVISDVVNNNLDKNISTISKDIKQIAKDTKDIDENTVNIYSQIYLNIDLNQSSKVKNLNPTDISKISDDIKEQNPKVKKLYEQVLGNRLSQYVKDSNSTIKSDYISSITTTILNNDPLKNKFNDLSSSNTKSTNLTIESINKNFKDKNFIYTDNSTKISDDLEQKTFNRLNLLYDDTSKTQKEKFTMIKAIEINTKLTDLNKEFDEDDYDSRLNALNSISKELNEKSTLDNTIDLDTSYIKIEKKLESNLEKNISIEDSYIQISDKLDDYIVRKKEKKIIIDDFSFPQINNIKMPEFSKIIINE